MNKKSIRNMTIALVAFTPMLYLVLMLLIWYGTYTSFTDYNLDLIVLIIGVVISMSMTFLLLIKSWSKDFDQKEYIKLLLYSAVFHIPSLVGLFIVLYNLT